MQLQVHQLRPPRDCWKFMSSTQFQSLLFCLLMADLLPGTPRALRFWISAELGGPSTSRGFASRSRSCIPGCSTGSCSALPCTSAAAQGAPLPPSHPGLRKDPIMIPQGSHPLDACSALGAVTQPNPRLPAAQPRSCCWNSSQPTLELRPPESSGTSR